MTISVATSVAESWLIGRPSSQTSTAAGAVIRAQFTSNRPLPLPSTLSLDELIAGYEADEERAKSLRDARVALAEELYRHRPSGLSMLRMRAGLSQAQLAARAATSQAHIARIEAGKNDPGTNVVARIAAALGVDETVAFMAIRVDQNSDGERV